MPAVVRSNVTRHVTTPICPRTIENSTLAARTAYVVEQDGPSAWQRHAPLRARPVAPIRTSRFIVSVAQLSTDNFRVVIVKGIVANRAPSVVSRAVDFNATGVFVRSTNEPDVAVFWRSLLHWIAIRPPGVVFVVTPNGFGAVSSAGSAIVVCAGVVFLARSVIETRRGTHVV